jgi:lysophospholipase L1-like esterase
LNRARAARALATAAVYGGGGLGVLGGAFYGVLAAQARLARRVIGPAQYEPPDGSGMYGSGLPGDELSLAMLGDSGAAGYGMDHPWQTPGALLAAGLSDMARRPVRLTTVAVVGAETGDLHEQINRVLAAKPIAAAVVIGANDVTHRVRPSESVRLLGSAVRRLREAGCLVVVGTCPDLGTVRPIAQPLRQVARLWSRRLAAAQTIMVVEAGGRSVSLGSILGPEFDAQPGTYFGPDQFHPSEAGYASIATVMLPSLAAGLGLYPDNQDLPEARRGDGVLPISQAAVQAAKTPGTEVARTDLVGRESGPRGRWVLLRHRRRKPIPTIDGADVAEPADRSGEVHSANPEGLSGRA